MKQCYDCQQPVTGEYRLEVPQPFSCGNIRWERVPLCALHALERLALGPRVKTDVLD